MRIQSEQYQPRQIVLVTIVVAVLLGGVDLVGQALVGSGAGSWILHGVCGLTLLWWVSVTLRLRRKSAATWVEICQAGIGWSAPADVVRRAGLAPPGWLAADQVTEAAIVDGMIRLRVLVVTRNVRVLQLRLTGIDGMRYVLPNVSSRRRTSPVLGRMVAAIQATPGLPAVDTSRLPEPVDQAAYSTGEGRDRWADFRGLTWWQTVLSLLPLALIPIGGAIGGGIGGVYAVLNLRVARASIPAYRKVLTMTAVVVLAYGTAAVVISGVRTVFFGQPGSSRTSVAAPVPTPTPTTTPHIQPPGDNFAPPLGSSCAPRQAKPGDPTLLRGFPGPILRQPTVIHASGAELSWPSGAGPGLALTGYQVYRGTCPTFEPSDSTMVAQLASGQTSYVDTTAPQGQVAYYMVVAVTSEGLAPGPIRTVQVPPLGGTTVVIPARLATTLSSNHPTSVWNTSSNISKSQPGVDVGVEAASDGTARGVFGFGALTGLPPDAQVASAHLNLTVQGTDRPGTPYEVTSLMRPIVGSQVSWTHASAAVLWTRAGGDYVTGYGGELPLPGDAPDRRNFDVTYVVRGWAHSPAALHNLLVKAATEPSTHGLVQFGGLEETLGDPSALPTLTITYTLPVP